MVGKRLDYLVSTDCQAVTRWTIWVINGSDSEGEGSVSCLIVYSLKPKGEYPSPFIQDDMITVTWRKDCELLTGLDRAQYR